MYIRFHFKSQSLMRSVGVHMFLPGWDGYEDVKTPPYPTLYFLPGYSASAEELALLLPFRRFATEHGVAVVIPDGENSFYTDHPERCTLYSTYVGEELVQITRKFFPSLSHQREDTWIGGISMGGYGACTNGLRWHDTFSRVVMMSPAIDASKLLYSESAILPSQLFTAWMGNKEIYQNSWMNPEKSLLDAKAAGRAIPRLFMCCGRQDELVYEACKDFVAFAKQEELPLTYVEDEGLHDLPFWDRMMEPAFRFLDEAY